MGEDSTDIGFGPGNYAPAEQSGLDSFVNGPLADLFKSKYNYKALQYPADLDSPGKGHQVIFEIFNVKSTSIEEATSYVAKPLVATYEKGVQLKNAFDAAGGGIKGAEASAEILANDAAAKAAEGLQYGQKIYGNNGAGIWDAATEYVANFQVPKKEFQTSVTLYMPDSLNFGYDVGYDGSSTSLASAAASAPIIGGIASAVTGVLDNQAAKLALRQFGYAFNPQAQMLFDNINFRTYSMSFTFTPRSQQEAAKVQEIIQTFRKHAAPTIMTGAAGFFFTPPSIFNVRFWSNGKENKNINKITDSVIENVDVNYAPNGWSAHHDGAPVQVTMTLNFKEISLIDRTKIQNGY